MKILGIIGGTGPESTIDYYRGITESYFAQKGDGNYPQIIINSVNLKKLIDWVTAGELNNLAEFLLQEINRLSAAGADFGLIAANTPHIVFDRITDKSPIPLLSIVEATSKAIQAAKLNKVALLGTRFTMESDFYSKVFNPAGIQLILPNPEERIQIHNIYMKELLLNIFRDDTREALLRIVGRLKADEGIQSAILAGTELPLILKQESYDGLPFFDTTKIHVKAAIDLLLLDGEKRR
jgi:aspartate racemase